MAGNRITPSEIVSVRARNEIDTTLALIRELLGQTLRPEWIEKLKRAGYKPPPKYLYDVYVDDLPLPEAETGSAERPYIEFSISLPLVLRAFFVAIMSETSIFNGLEDVSILSPPYSPRGECDWKGLISLIEDFSINRFERWMESVPATGFGAHAGRVYLAISLSLQMAVFAAYHELGHNRMGHIRLVRQRRAAGENLPHYLRHAFELEADHQAIATMFEYFYRRHSLSEERGATPERASLLKMSRRSRYRVWTTATGCVFLLLHLVGRDSDDLISSHPPALYRLKHSIDWTRSYFFENGRDGLADYDNAVKAAMGDLARVSTKLGIQSPFRYFDQDNSDYEQQMAAARGGVAAVMRTIMEALQAEEDRSRIRQ